MVLEKHHASVDRFSPIRKDNFQTTANTPVLFQKKRYPTVPAYAFYSYSELSFLGSSISKVFLAGGNVYALLSK